MAALMNKGWRALPPTIPKRKSRVRSCSTRLHYLPMRLSGISSGRQRSWNPGYRRLRRPPTQWTIRFSSSSSSKHGIGQQDSLWTNPLHPQGHRGKSPRGIRARRHSSSLCNSSAPSSAIPIDFEASMVPAVSGMSGDREAAGDYYTRLQAVTADRDSTRRELLLAQACLGQR